MSELDPLIHAPKRLRIMAILSSFDHVTFALLQERLGLAASDLSKQLAALQQVKYVRTSKTGRGPGSQTWVAITRAGKRAYDQHVTALRAVLDGTDDDGRAPSDVEPEHQH